MLLPFGKQNRPLAATSMPGVTKFRLVLLLHLFLVVVVTIGIVMLLIQMHFIHVHMSAFSTSIDHYMLQLQQQGPHQQQQQQEELQRHHQRQHDVSVLGKARSKTSTTMSTNVDHELEPILKILRQAGYTDSDFDDRTLASLPKWSNIVAAYGPPRILCIETCQQFRKSVRPWAQRLGVAGTFNTGTNLLHSLLATNCRNKRVNWQVRSARVVANFGLLFA
jgi:hypothetical protein